jgi:outer membrane protein assembly factor BamE (lipoprotein component of BamABCDE complex)
MKFDQKLLRRFLSLYGVFYVLLYVGYIFFIYVLHSSYSVISISAILLPFIFLLLLELVLWKHTDNNLRSDRKVKNKYKIITSLGSIPPLLCAVILGLSEYKSNFTADKWLNNHTERVYMVDDFLNDFDLNDKTKDEVISLLGTPTETEYFKDDNNIVYYLGDERGLIPIDSEWLVIDFDDRERVKKYDVLTD